MRKIFIKTIGSFFGIICTTITLLQFFAETDTYKAFIEKYPFFVLSTKTKIVILVIVFGFIISYNIWEYLKKSKTAKECAEKMHMFHHELRNQIFVMKTKNAKDPEMSHETFYELTKEKCYKLCEFICGFLKDGYGKDYSVCIKMIESDSKDGKINIDKTFVYTLCRAGARYAEREKNEKQVHSDKINDSGEIFVSVKENYDFYTILSNAKKHVRTTAFACSNLLMLLILSKILKNVKYYNTTPKFWKYYKSAIVVPIRIENCYLKKSQNQSKQDTFQTVGFLCVDYKKPISKAEKEEIVGYLKSFGDSLYDLFFEFAKMDRAIKSK